MTNERPVFTWTGVIFVKFSLLSVVRVAGLKRLSSQLCDWVMMSEKCLKISIIVNLIPK